MKGKVIFAILILAALALGGVFLYKNKKEPATSSAEIIFETESKEVTMRMGDNGYNPINLKIRKGAKVTFVNESKNYRWPASDLHPSHLIFPELDAKRALAPGEKWDFVFEEIGEWGYHDHLAPYITGTITVGE